MGPKINTTDNHLHEMVLSHTHTEMILFKKSKLFYFSLRCTGYYQVIL